MTMKRNSSIARIRRSLHALAASFALLAGSAHAQPASRAKEAASA